MIFARWIWKNAPDEAPVEAYFVLDSDRYEIEKFELFRDGTWGFDFATQTIGQTWLCEKPVPSFDEINQDEESKRGGVEVIEISQIEYMQKRKSVLGR